MYYFLELPSRLLQSASEAPSLGSLTPKINKTEALPARQVTGTSTETSNLRGRSGTLTQAMASPGGLLVHAVETGPAPTQLPGCRQHSATGLGGGAAVPAHPGSDSKAQK